MLAFEKISICVIVRRRDRSDYMDQIEKIYHDIIRDSMNINLTNNGYMPVFMAYRQAKILIIGQAPGLKTQEKGMVFKDKSGERLRQWMGVDEDIFYHSGLISVLPLDFYYPGKAKTGDLPPRLDFADKWHPKLLSLMPNIQLTLLIGQYAQRYYLKERIKKNLTQTVLHYEEYLPEYFVLVHPSPLNFRWFNKHPEFETKTIPILKQMIQDILNV